ncbi:MAG: hypothetical protein ACK559_02200, partial [bacterium]
FETPAILIDGAPGSGEARDHFQLLAAMDQRLVDLAQHERDLTRVLRMRVEGVRVAGHREPERLRLGRGGETDRHGASQQGGAIRTLQGHRYASI